MKIVHQDYEQLTVLSLKGELSAEASEALRRVVGERLAHKTRDFVLDCGDLEFVDSKGLETMLWLQEQAGERLGQVRLAAATPTIEKIFEMTRLSAQFDRHADVDAAIKSLR